MADPRKFLDIYPSGLVIDEAHHYPELFSFVQVTVDQNPDR